MDGSSTNTNATSPVARQTHADGLSPGARTTRLAPSPTGTLHLGNARTFLITYAIARQRGWRIVFRMEDLDMPRVKPGAVEQALDDCNWLGLTWDDGPHYQVADLSPYHAALSQLAAAGRTYVCRCSRREIEQAQSAPHAEDGEMRYPGTCRDKQGDVALLDQAKVPNSPAAVRLIVPDESISWDDVFAGPQSINVQRHVGDFVIATKAGLPAYQLAVVVDDARQGVTEVIRGDDLISSAARQMWLYRFLNHRPPTWWHLPMVVDEDGRRLAKRHGDGQLATLRDHGVRVERVIGLIARWSGINSTGKRTEMDLATFVARFDPAAMDRGPVRFTKEDWSWVMG